MEKYVWYVNTHCVTAAVHIAVYVLILKVVLEPVISRYSSKNIFL